MRKTPGLLANTCFSSAPGPPSSYKDQGGTAGKSHSRASRAGAPKADGVPASSNTALLALREDLFIFNSSLLLSGITHTHVAHPLSLRCLTRSPEATPQSGWRSRITPNGDGVTEFT